MSIRNGNWISPQQPEVKEETICDNNWFRSVCESLKSKANMKQRQIKKLKRELKRANKLQEIEEEEIQYLRGRNVFFFWNEGGRVIKEFNENAN